MKILGISCSPREDGNTEILIKKALESAGHKGAETEFLTVRDRELQTCDGCLSCYEDMKCHIEDGMQEIYTKILDANGIIWVNREYSSPKKDLKHR